LETAVREKYERQTDEATLRVALAAASPAMARDRVSEFRQFVDWCAWNTIEVPATGADVAAYLLDLAADGVPLKRLHRVAAAIGNTYIRNAHFLDYRPVREALEIAAALTAANRTIN
jgi:hypothetical protein